MDDVGHLARDLLARPGLQPEPRAFEVRRHRDRTVVRQLHAQRRDRIAQPLVGLARVAAAHEGIHAAVGVRHITREHLTTHEARRAGQQDRSVPVTDPLAVHGCVSPGRARRFAQAKLRDIPEPAETNPVDVTAETRREVPSS